MHASLSLPPSLSSVCLVARSSAIAEAEALRTKHREATDLVSEVEGEIREVEAKMKRDYGPAMRFEPLSRQCIEFKPGGEFSYELCPFVDAKQKDSSGGSTQIGKWERFSEDHSQMIFENGQYCWNAGARTLTVSLSCATANKILGVEEPEVCKYAMRLETPAACTAEDLEAAEADAKALSPDGSTHDEL